MARDRAYQYVHHHEECRTRMEALMREDAGFRHRVENADIRMTQRIADVLERRDREEHERKRPRFAPEQPNGSAQDHNVKGHPPEIAEKVQSESQGGTSSSGIPTEEDVVIGDDMGIPLATDDVMGSEAKRKKEEEEDSGAPKATRQKLECVFHLEGKTEFDVSEIFSRPRVCPIARDLSLRAGFSLNSETKDTHTDKSWNFLHKKEQARLMTLLAKRPSQLLVVSLPSEMFMSQQRTGRVGTMQEEIDQGVLLLRVAVRVCRFQMKSGRHFIFEHPREASSWADPELAALMHDNSVEVVDLDQCMYGLETKDEVGMGPVRLPTRLLTNMKTARVVLSKRCNHQHRHVQTLDNNVKLTKEYPEELCRAILETLRLERGDEVRSDRLEVSGGFCGGLDKDEDLEIKDELHEEVEDLTLQWFDDRTGQPLDPAKVRLGRAREYEKLTQREVYEPVLRTNAMKSKDAKFIRTKRVDTQKGDDVRCRFVGQEIAAGDPRTDLFASTPPLFLARTVVSMVAWERTRPWSLMALDVSCAFLYAKVHGRSTSSSPQRIRWQQKGSTWVA